MGIYADYLGEHFSYNDLVAEHKHQLRRVAEARGRDVLVIAADLQSRLAALTGTISSRLAISSATSAATGLTWCSKPQGDQERPPRT